MSNIMLTKQGGISLALTGQVEMTTGENAEITRLESQTSQLRCAESSFKSEIVRLETKLLGNPDYTQLLKMREKVQIAKRMAREAQTIINYKVSEVLKRNDIQTPAEFYSRLLPDPEPKTEKRRGRPRRNLLPETTTNN